MRSPEGMRSERGRHSLTPSPMGASLLAAATAVTIALKAVLRDLPSGRCRKFDGHASVSSVCSSLVSQHFVRSGENDTPSCGGRAVQNILLYLGTPETQSMKIG